MARKSISLTPKSDITDISSAFDHPDPEEGQRIFDNLPHATHAKLRSAVQAHLNQSLGSNAPTDWEANPPDASETGAQAFSSGQKAIASDEAISNISQGQNPVIPAPKPKVTRPASSPDFSTLGE